METVQQIIAQFKEPPGEHSLNVDLFRTRFNVPTGFQLSIKYEILGGLHHKIEGGGHVASAGQEYASGCFGYGRIIILISPTSKEVNKYDHKIFSHHIGIRFDIQDEYFNQASERFAMFPGFSDNMDFWTGCMISIITGTDEELLEQLHQCPVLKIWSAYL